MPTKAMLAWPAYGRDVSSSEDALHPDRSSATPPPDPWPAGAPISPYRGAEPPPPDSPPPAPTGSFPRWLLVLLVLAGIGAAIAFFPSERRHTSAKEPAAAPPAVVPVATSSAPLDVLVTYEVLASGSRSVGSIEYADADGTIIRRHGISLPWRLTFRVTGRQPPLVIVSQRHEGGDGGAVTCRITVGEKVVSTATHNGRFASAQCFG
jgi:hypothetical protein